MTGALIGLLGKKRSGKDTFAARLALLHGYSRVAFADPLKQAALALDPIVGPASIPGHPRPDYRRLSEVVSVLGWEVAKDHVPEVRQTLQRLGTESIRALDDGFWVRLTMAEVQRRREGTETYASDGQLIDNVARDVVVTDVRMLNEAQAIEEAGGTLVRITRPGLAQEGDAHLSETALDSYPVPHIVVNDGTLADLFTRVDTLMRDISGYTSLDD